MILGIKNILAPVDFSGTAGNALQVAVELCKKHGATLHLLHVMENVYAVAAAGPYIPAVAAAGKDEEEIRERFYKTYGPVINDPALTVQLHLPPGKAFDEICKLASEITADLVVMGTHGAAGLKELIMGTTAYSVIRNITRPVLTIPAGFTYRGFKKILFPVRPVKDVLAKYEFIKALLENEKIALHVAVLGHDGEEAPPGSYGELDEIMAGGNKLWKRCTYEFYTCSNYAAKVLELAGKTNADLIAINVTLDYKWTEIFTGPYTRQVVNHSHIPVLSYRA